MPVAISRSKSQTDLGQTEGKKTALIRSQSVSGLQKAADSSSQVTDLLLLQQQADDGKSSSVSAASPTDDTGSQPAISDQSPVQISPSDPSAASPVTNPGPTSSSATSPGTSSTVTNPTTVQTPPSTPPSGTQTNPNSQAVQSAQGAAIVSSTPTDPLSVQTMEKSEAAKETATIGGGINQGVESLIGGNEMAQQLFGTVADGVEKAMGMFRDGKEAWKKRDWKTGGNFLLEAGDTTHKIFTQLDKFGVEKLSGTAADLMPGIGAGIGVFKSALKTFTLSKEIGKIEELEKNLGLNEEEKQILTLYINRLNVNLKSEIIEFVLGFAEVIGSFAFPPLAVAAKTLKTAKAIFIGALEFWREYKGAKERQALVRVSGEDESLSDEKSSSLAELQKFDLRNSSLQELVVLSDQYERSEKEIAQLPPDDASIPGLEANKLTLDQSISESILKYNELLKLSPETQSYQISRSDVSNLTQIHQMVVKKVMEKSQEQRGFLTALRRKIRSEKKEIILKEVFNGSLPPEINISELAKSQHADYFWIKTEEAMKTALKGRIFFSNAELKQRVKVTLKKYQVSDEEIAEALG